MGIDQYVLTVDRAKVNFDFISDGPKGQILKTVRYTKIKIKGINNLYNLAFGDRLVDSDDIDDLTISGNQDRDKILATVVATIFIFTQRYPTTIVFFKGSTPARTRLYQMAINKHFEALKERFDIDALNDEGWSSFEPNKNYSAFSISLK